MSTLSLTPGGALDFARLQAPPEHGGVLVEPAPREWARWVERNRDSLDRAAYPLLGRPVSEWRRQLRGELVGETAQPVIALGHQPEFIHPGVWAKHVVAARAARAIGARAVNFIVDSDQLRQWHLDVPSTANGELEVRSIPFTHAPADLAFEQVPSADGNQIAAFAGEIRQALGPHFEMTPMPRFLQALLPSPDNGGWVGQMVAARRAVEKSFGVELEEHRVRETWCNPLVLDMLLNAGRFAESYNRALAGYRREHRVRGARRPMPDLAIDGDRIEVALWAYRQDRPRRRVFVESQARRDRLILWAEGRQIAVLQRSRMTCCEDLAGQLDTWQLRPRALTLTLWARLLACDLFIHGIGGAKYDRISNTIIADFYGLTPPAMACVSATLRLGLADGNTSGEELRRAMDRMRDAKWNPQRHVSDDGAFRELKQQRKAAVERSRELAATRRNDRRSRRGVFEQIRELNRRLLESGDGILERRKSEVAAAAELMRRRAVARRRDWFFCLYPVSELERLVSALPDVDDFAPAGGNG